MRAGVTPGPTRTPTSPLGYLTHRGSAELRLFPTCTLFIRWRVLYVSHSILLTQIIRKLPPLRATLCSRTCRLSRLCPGNNDHLMLYFVFTYTFVLNLFVFSVPRQNSAKGRRRTSRSKSRTCLNRRLQLKNRQLPLPLQLKNLKKLLLTRRPPVWLTRSMTRTW